MPALPPDALIFDMDGLLVDSEPLWLEVSQAFCSARGFAWTAEHHAACVGGSLRATLSAMGRRFGFDVDHDRDVAAVVSDFIDRVGGLALKPGAADLLALTARAGLPAALASSSPRRLIDAVLERFALRPRFRAVVSGDDVAHPKPAPDIFLLAASALGVPPGRCAVLEDSLNGARAARAAGTIVVAVPEGAWQGRGFEELADVCLPSLEGAARWLRIDAAARGGA